MKYRLRKDLPFAKAGAVVTYIPKTDEYYSIQMCSTHPERPETFYIRLECDNRDLAEIIKEGWIEEVKPREFFLNIHRSGNIYVTDTLGSALGTRWGKAEDNEIIKVREAIDEI